MCVLQREGIQPVTCETCTADERLEKIEEQLKAIYQLLDQTAKAVSELKKKK